MNSRYHAELIAFFDTNGLQGMWAAPLSIALNVSSAALRRVLHLAAVKHLMTSEVAGMQNSDI